MTQLLFFFQEELIQRSVFIKNSVSDIQCILVFYLFIINLNRISSC